MKQLLSLLLFLLVTLIRPSNTLSQNSNRFCDDLDIDIPQCNSQEPIDLLFLLDASLSINQTDFRVTILPAIRNLICGFRAGTETAFGLATFNGQLREVIPLQKYTRRQWNVAIDNFIEEAEVNADKVFSCCTPLAEALDFAREIITTKGTHVLKTVVLISDGVPVQNKQGPYSNMNPAQYALRQLPESANKLKNLGVRLMVAKVDAESGVTDCEFFLGIPLASRRPRNGGLRTQCFSRGGRKFCDEMEIPPFPIASKPLERNNFCVKGFSNLFKDLIDDICTELSELTRSPTPAPTTRINSLDLFFIVDLSDSINDYSNLCKDIPRDEMFSTGDSSKACLGVILQFILDTALELSKVKNVGWIGDFPENSIDKGIQVRTLGFSCSKNQKNPITFDISDAQTEEELKAQLKTAYDSLVLDGTTCPSETIDQAVYEIEQGSQIIRPMQTLIYISDGLTSPRNIVRTRTSLQGLRFFDIKTYALGLAIPNSNNKFGLSKDEQNLQQNQLMQVVGGKSERLIRLSGPNAFAALSKLVSQLGELLLQGHVLKPRNQAYCGYSTKEVCLLKPTICGWRNGKCNFI